MLNAPADITPVDLDKVNRGGPGLGGTPEPAATDSGDEEPGGLPGPGTGGGEDDSGLNLPCASALLVFLVLAQVVIKPR